MTAADSHHIPGRPRMCSGRRVGADHAYARQARLLRGQESSLRSPSGRRRCGARLGRHAAGRPAAHSQLLASTLHGSGWIGTFEARCSSNPEPANPDRVRRDAGQSGRRVRVLSESDAASRGPCRRVRCGPTRGRAVTSPPPPSPPRPPPPPARRPSRPCSGGPCPGRPGQSIRRRRQPRRCYGGRGRHVGANCGRATCRLLRGQESSLRSPSGRRRCGARLGRHAAGRPAAHSQLLASTLHGSGWIGTFEARCSSNPEPANPDRVRRDAGQSGRRVRVLSESDAASRGPCRRVRCGPTRGRAVTSPPPPSPPRPPPPPARRPSRPCSGGPCPGRPGQSIRRRRQPRRCYGGRGRHVGANCGRATWRRRVRMCVNVSALVRGCVCVGAGDGEQEGPKVGKKEEGGGREKGRKGGGGTKEWVYEEGTEARERRELVSERTSEW